MPGAVTRERSAEIRREVARLHGEGLSDTEMARRIGANRETVVRHRKALGLPCNRYGKPKGGADPHLCACGCGGAVVGKSARWCPGHHLSKAARSQLTPGREAALEEQMSGRCGLCAFSMRFSRSRMARFARPAVCSGRRPSWMP